MMCESDGLADLTAVIRCFFWPWALLPQFCALGWDASAVGCCWYYPAWMQVYARRNVRSGGWAQPQGRDRDLDQLPWIGDRSPLMIGLGKGK